MLKQLDRTQSRRALEGRVFTAAMAIGLVHAVDDALLHRQLGAPVGQHLWALALVAGAGVVAMLLFGRLRPGLRSALALVAGAVTLTNGAMHVIHVVTVGAEASDLSGLLAAASGLAFLGLGVAIPVRHRGVRHGGRPSSGRRRWVNRGVAVVAGAVVAQFLVVPVGLAIVQTHKYREPTVAAPGPSFDPVGFDSSDGLRLSGWYVPSRNRAAVVLVNSAAGDRSGSVRHAELLAAHGYGVLLFDARGSGQSEGSPNGWGWDWEYDVEGALAFLQNRPDIDPQRIGALGLSTGADVLIEMAATNRDLKVVVADGATGRSFADRPPGAFNVPFAWTMFAAGQVLSGSSPGEPLRDLVAQVRNTPLLLVAAGSLPGEIEINQRYAAAGGDPVELWKLPEVTHTNAIAEVADEYERRVVGRLDAALLG